MAVELNSDKIPSSPSPTVSRHQRISGFDLDPNLTLDFYAKIRDNIRFGLFCLLSIASFGVIYILSFWFPALYIHLITEDCASFAKATHIYVKSNSGPQQLVHLQQQNNKKQIKSADAEDATTSSSQPAPFINYYSLIFFLGENEQWTYVDQLSRYIGNRDQRQQFYPRNTVDLTVQYTFSSYVEYSVLNPTIFFLLILFGSQAIVLKKPVMLLLSFFQIILMVLGRWRAHRIARQASGIFSGLKVKLITEEVTQKTQNVDATDLVPGDEIIIDAPCLVPADCLLLTGTGLVDETLLTGESVPVYKFGTGNPTAEARSEAFTRATHQNILYAGSTIKSIAAPFRLLVHNTGTVTLRSKMMIIGSYPRTAASRIQNQLQVTMYTMFGLVMLFGFLLKIAPYTQSSWKRDLALSMLLTCFTSCGQFSFCSIPWTWSSFKWFAFSKIDVSNYICMLSYPNIDLVAFDKTGTLTKQTMSIKCILGEDLREVDNQTVDQRILKALAMCHTLYEYKGKMYGDSMEGSAYDTSKAVYNAQQGTYSIPGIPVMQIIQKLFFCAKRKRQSVVLSDGTLICKGAPEKMKHIIADLPSEYDYAIEEYASKGYRVLTYAARSLTESEMEQMSKITGDNVAIQSLDRDSLESNLSFICMAVFENPLKRDSADVVGQLKAAHKQVIMITGDSPLTASTIAKKVGIISTLGPLNDPIYYTYKNKDVWKWRLIDMSTRRKSMVQGKRLNVVVEELDITQIDKVTFPVYTGDYFEECGLNETIMRSGVFARCSPTQKAAIVRVYRERGIKVFFCGDGANDCNAMQAANCSLALSKADAAAVSATFVSRKEDINDVIRVLKECKTIVAKIGKLYYWSVANTLAMIIATLFLVPRGSGFSMLQFLIPILTSYIFSLALSLTRTSASLSKYVPQANLLKTRFLLSMLIFVIADIVLYAVLTGVYDNTVKPIMEVLKPKELLAELVMALSNAKLVDNLFTKLISSLTCVDNTSEASTACSLTFLPVMLFNSFAFFVYDSYLTEVPFFIIPFILFGLWAWDFFLVRILTFGPVNKVNWQVGLILTDKYFTINQFRLIIAAYGLFIIGSYTTFYWLLHRRRLHIRLGVIKGILFAKSKSSEDCIDREAVLA